METTEEAGQDDRREDVVESGEVVENEVEEVEEGKVGTWELVLVPCWGG